MNTELKNSTSKIVAEIKQQLRANNPGETDPDVLSRALLHLTQENEVLRNCWNKEQAENEELRVRVRCLTSLNATLRHHNNSLASSIKLLEQGLMPVREEEKIAPPVRHFDRRIHNLESGEIFKGNGGWMDSK